MNRPAPTLPRGWPSAMPGTMPMTARPLRNGLTIRRPGVPRSHCARRRDLIWARVLARRKFGIGGSAMFQFLRGIILIAAMMLNCGVGFTQTPPTAAEVFNLRAKCKVIADEKADSLEWHPLTIADGAALGWSVATVEAANKNREATLEVILSTNSSKYDAKNNRCYVEIFQHIKIGLHKEKEVQYRQIYDGQTDDLLAFAKVENGKKVGMVLDIQHRKTTDENLGWDDANAYIDEMMADKRY
jgi:hypothetical protein